MYITDITYAIKRHRNTFSYKNDELTEQNIQETVNNS